MLDVIFLSWMVPCCVLVIIPIFVVVRVYCLHGRRALYRKIHRGMGGLFTLFLVAYLPSIMAAIAIAYYASECPYIALLLLVALINVCLYPFRILLLGKHELGGLAICIEIEIILIFYLSWFWLYDLLGRWLFGFGL